MTRRAALLIILLITLTVALLVSGALFAPFLRPLERLAEKHAPIQLSIGWAHLSLTGEIVINNTEVRMDGQRIAVIPVARIRPAWRTLFAGTFACRRVALVRPTLAVDPELFKSPTASFDIKSLPAIIATAGTLSIIDARIQTADTQPAAGIYPVNLQCAMAAQKLQLKSLSLRTNGGVLTGSGAINFDTGSLAVNVETHDFPLDSIARLFMAVPPTVQLSHTGAWRFEGDTIRWKAGADGQLGMSSNALESNARLNVRAAGDGPNVTVNARLDGKRLAATGKAVFNTALQRMDGQLAASSVDVGAFADFWPALSGLGGSARAAATISGPWRSPDITVDASGDAIRYRETAVTSLRARIERSRDARDQFALTVNVSTVIWASGHENRFDIAAAELDWVGTGARGNLRLRARTRDGSDLTMNGPASQKNNGVSWRLDEFNAVAKNGMTFAARPGGIISVNTAGSFNLQDFRFGTAGASWDIQRFSYGSGQLAVESSADAFPFALNPEISGKKMPLSGFMIGDVSIHGPFNSPEGRFDVRIASASFGDFPLTDIRIQGTVGDAVVNIAAASIRWPGVPPVLISGKAPWSYLAPQAAGRAMDIAVKAGPFDPAVFAKDMQDIRIQSGGSAQVEGSLRGRRGALQMRGALSAYLPGAQMPSYGIDAREARLDAEINGHRLLIRTATVNLGKGTLSLAGESDLPALRYDIVGNQVSLKSSRSFDIRTDFRLKLTGTINAPVLTGSIHIDEGAYEMNRKKKKETDDAKESRLLTVWDTLQLALRVDWDNNVWYRDGMTKIDTKADLEVLKDHGRRIPGLRGEASLLKGTYEIYGRDFSIKTGELTFTDPAELDPLVELTAKHKMTDVEVEVNVSGTAKKPKIFLTSTPPMPEQDILATLALGKSRVSSSDTKGSGDVVSTGADLAANVASDYMTRSLRTSGMNVLDLDVVRVSPSDKGKEWTVGRYWGSRLFVSYSYNPSDAASQVLKAEYSLSPAWYLVGETGSDNKDYLDINFRIPVGRSRKQQSPPQKQ